MSDDPRLTDAIAQADRQWAHLRDMALAHDPEILAGLYRKLGSRRPLEDLEDHERPFVAALARMAIKRIYVLCSVDPET